MKKKYLYCATLLAILALSACSNHPEATADDSSATTTTTSSEITTDEDYFDALVAKVETITTDNYKSDDYLGWDYKTLLREPNKYFDVKMKLINLKILQVMDEGKYKKILTVAPNSEYYMLFIENKRLETNLLEDDVIFINGRYMLDYDYTTISNTAKKVPLVYVDGYLLDK
ncbi:hypothetical protein [Streptococcus cuniculi]|uniref:Uncharacterized protein n=1 Tax=Streptococcus cuniculi TaxID=1432788 RepID=A0A4Y9JCU8_9STRE|nr:hypothetical protein [Streptococcus cuniculi]MBF0778140.1 hypothetical protein [Streptococcus cuniculi]TFU97886.1 hypothetical protein E4T82_05325 [Streptococcus cuniculi]